MATVAEQLREAREQRKLSVYDVADLTKIKTDHIRALEEGRYEVFAAPVYIRGFVRTYATTLHLNVSKVICDLEAELGESERFQEPSLSAERQRTPLDVLSLFVARVNWRLALVSGIVMLIVVVAIGSYRKWEQNRSKDPLQALGPGLYRAPRTDAGEFLPLPTIVSTQNPSAL